MDSSVAFTMEPYRRGASFADWFTRLTYFFRVNQVEDEDKMAYFIFMSGPVIFSEIKLLFPAENVEELSLDDLVEKLKNRLDKTDSDIVQRYKFAPRMQNPNESTEDFILNLKLQAEVCGFGNYKQIAILDRLVAGIRDENLRQHLLSDDRLTLPKAEQIIVTWEVAQAYTGTADQQHGGRSSSISAVIDGSNQQLGVAATRLAKINELAKKHSRDETNSGRGPVESRQGTRPADRWQQTSREGRPSDSGGSHRQDGRPNGYRRQWLRPDYTQMICNFCGLKGHIRRKCFRLINMNREAVKLVDSVPGTSSNVHISEILQRMRSNADESINSDSDNVGNTVATAHNKQIRVCKAKTPWRGSTALIREQHDTVRSNPTWNTDADSEEKPDRRRHDSENDNLVLRRYKQVKQESREENIHYD